MYNYSMLKIRIFPVSRVALKKPMFFPTLFHVLSKNVAISLRGVHTVVHMVKVKEVNCQRRSKPKTLNLKKKNIKIDSFADNFDAICPLWLLHDSYSNCN